MMRFESMSGRGHEYEVPQHAKTYIPGLLGMELHAAHVFALNRGDERTSVYRCGDCGITD